MARAAQRYGVVVRDRSAAVAFYAQNPVPFGADPYPQLLGGQAPWDLLAAFPWRHLKLVGMELRRMPDDGGRLPVPAGGLNACD